MATRMHHLSDEKKFTALIVAYYIYFLDKINDHYGHEANGAGFIPSLFLRSHIALRIFYSKLKQSFVECGFHPVIINVADLNFSTAQDLNHLLVQPLLNMTNHIKNLRLITTLHRIRIFTVEHLGKIILVIVIAGFILDFYYIDITHPHALKQFFQHGSIFILVLGLFTKIFGSLLPKIFSGLISFRHQVNIFQNKFWRKLISKLNHQRTPLVIMFEQIEALEDVKLLLLLQVIQNLRDNGIICIAAGSSELLSATINSKQTHLTGEFITEAYSGVNYGDMMLSASFNINVFFQKNYVNIDEIEQHTIKQAAQKADELSEQEELNAEPAPCEIPEEIEEITFLNNAQIKNTIASILDPFTHYLHLKQEGIMGLIESLRLYATLLDTNKENELNALLVFIIASKYDRAWLKATCYNILTKSHSPAEAKSDEAPLETTPATDSNFTLDQNKNISALFKTTLENAKDIIDACYGLSGQLKVSPN